MKNKFNKLVLLYFLIIVSANFIHPITPLLVKMRGLPDYMFGVAFAVMSITNFFFSSMWGKISDAYGRRNIIVIGMTGYVFGQIIFSRAYDINTLIMARLISGFFNGAMHIPIFAYIIDISKKEEIKNRINITVAFSTVGTSIGYFVGGMVGIYGINLNFYIQFIVFTGLILFTFMAFSENKKFERKLSFKSVVKSFNPFEVFIRVKFEKKEAYIFLAMSFFIFFSNVMYENAFSYYLPSQLDLNSNVNGMFKAFTGLMTLILNMTVMVYVLRNLNIYNSILTILGFSVSMLVGVIFSTDIFVFFLTNVCFYIVFSMIIPLQQAIIMENVDEDNRGAASGMINGARAIGSIIGAFSYSFVYTISSNKYDYLFKFSNMKIIAPVVICIFMLLISMGIIMYSKKNPNV